MQPWTPRLLQPLLIPRIQCCPHKSKHPFTNSSFVDDNGVVDLIRRIASALHQSVVSACILYGFPGTDRRGDCFAKGKFEMFISAVAEYLGFEIDCDQLLVTWPKRKCIELRDMIIALIRDSNGNDIRRPTCAPKLVTSIIGKLQSASIVAPWGPYLAFPLMKLLRQSVHRSLAAGLSANRWWRHSQVRIGGQQCRHLSLITQFLENDKDPTLWSCPIALMVPRDPTVTLLSDASYAGIGGWSPTYGIMWRVMHQDLVDLGFPMKKLRRFQAEPLDVKSKGLHINPLEFLGTIINIWLHLVLEPSLPSCPTGHILELLADNTTALSWCRLTSLTKNELLQPWACFVATLLVLAHRQNTRVQPDHIQGIKNHEADCLSHSDDGVIPSWEAMCDRHSRLATCRICLLPCKLLVFLAQLLGSNVTEEALVQKTTKLLTLGVNILPSGSRPRNLQSSLQPE